MRGVIVAPRPLPYANLSFYFTVKSVGENHFSLVAWPAATTVLHCSHILHTIFNRSLFIHLFAAQWSSMYDCRWCSAVCFQISSNTKFRTMQFSGSFHVENLVQVCLSMLYVSSVKMLATAPVSPCRLTRILLSSYLFPLCQSLFTYVSDFRLAGKLRMHWGIWTWSKAARTVNTRLPMTSRHRELHMRAHARKMASWSLDICPSCPLAASVNSHYSTQKMNPWTAIRSECTVIWQWDQI